MLEPDALQGFRPTYYIFDRGYNVFEWLYRIHRLEAYFVLRVRDNLKFKRMYSYKADKDEGVKHDQIGIFALPNSLRVSFNETVVIVFNKNISDDLQRTHQENYGNYQIRQELPGGWEVCYDPSWGGSESIFFPELIDWINHDKEGIYYFSGKPTYKKSVQASF